MTSGLEARDGPKIEKICKLTGKVLYRIRILDPDPAIFVIDLLDASKKQIF